MMSSQRVPFSDRTNQINKMSQNAKKLNICSSKTGQTKQRIISLENKINSHKQNQPQSTENKKIKLSLKHITKPLQKQKNNAIQSSSENNKKTNVQNKSANTKQKGQYSSKTKNIYFQPQIINFSLKTISQQIKSKQLSKNSSQEKHIQTLTNNKNTTQKQKPKVKNYILLKFLTQFTNSLMQVIGQEQITQLKYQLTNNETKNQQQTSKQQAQSQNHLEIPIIQLSYNKLIKLLHKLHMVSEQSQTNYKLQIQQQKQQLKKIYQLWKIIKINSSNNQNLIQTLILLLRIMNIEYNSLQTLIRQFLQKLNQSLQKHDKDKQSQRQKNKNLMQQKQSNRQQNTEPLNIFFIRNKKLLNRFPAQNIQCQTFFNVPNQMKNQLIKEFELFKINRFKLNQIKTNLSQKQHNEVNTDFSIQSIISPKSQQLALTKRLKILEQLKIQNQLNLNQIKQFDVNSPINLFLNYKSSKKCSAQKNQQRATRQNKIQNNKQSKALFKKKEKQPNICQSKQNKQKPISRPPSHIPSQKIKFSQMKCIINMQKARQLKLQKQKMKQKGWTNNQNFSKQKIIRQKSISTLRTQTLKSQTLKSQNNQKIGQKYQLKENKLINILFESKNNRRERSNTESIDKRPQQTKRKASIKDIYRFQQMVRQQPQKITSKDVSTVQNHRQLKNHNLYHNKSKDSKHTISIDSQQPIYFQDMYAIGPHNTQQNEILDDSMIQQSENRLITEASNVDNHQKNQFNEVKAQNEIQNVLKDMQTKQLTEKCATESNETDKLITFQTQDNEQFIEQSSLTSDNKQDKCQQNQTKQNSQRKSQQNRVIKSYLKIPILYVDVNMDESKKQRIVIYEEDKPDQLARQFGRKHNLDFRMIQRLEEMLSEQINGILGRIDEEQQEYDETKQELFDDGQLFQNQVQEEKQQLQQTQQQ